MKIVEIAGSDTDVRLVGPGELRELEELEELAESAEPVQTVPAVQPGCCLRLR